VSPGGSEVLCQVGDLAAYDAIEGLDCRPDCTVRARARSSLRPQVGDVDRPDRPIKNRDLAALLGFYLDRSERYGVVLPEAAEEAHYFLRRLDERPYTLRFTRSAVVFDFSKPGTEPAEHENGIEFYRIGSDLIRQLVEAAVKETETLASVQAGQSADVTREATQELLRRRSLGACCSDIRDCCVPEPPARQDASLGPKSASALFRIRLNAWRQGE
jgi:DNA phosphorothioation-dependent restriction protein DptH